MIQQNNTHGAEKAIKAKKKNATKISNPTPDYHRFMLRSDMIDNVVYKKTIQKEEHNQLRKYKFQISRNGTFGH